MRHNKKRNTALLYEFLVRHVSKCLVEKRGDEAVKAVNLIKRHFKVGPLREELDLFNAAFQSNIKTREYAMRVLSAVLEEAKNINANKLDVAKGKLIKEINKTFESRDIFSHKIPHYVMYATLQTLINDESGKKKLPFSKLQMEERLVDFISKPRTSEQTLNESLRMDPVYNNAVYRIVVNKFEKKYDGVLSENQKKLLTRYALSKISNNSNPLEAFIVAECSRIFNKLDFITDRQIVEDKDLMKKIQECKAKLRSRDISGNDSDIVMMLRYMSLADEVAS